MLTLSELTLGVFRDDVYPALDAEITPSEHPSTRARLRHWILSRLRAAALEPERIAPNRGIPTQLLDVPAVLLYTLRDPEPEDFSRSPLVLQRPLEVAFHIIIAEESIPAGASIDDVLDAFCTVVERVLLLDVNAAGQFFNGDASDCALGATEIESEPTAERMFIHARITLRVPYQDTVERPAGNVLRELDARWDVAPPDGQLEAIDTILYPAVGELDGLVALVGEFAGTITP